jgi:AraC-like DNA-binding protein
MKLYIKYMVSLRCKLVVKDELDKLGLQYGIIDLGVVEVPLGVSQEQQVLLRKGLLRSGLELMDDKKSMLIEEAKNLILEMIYYSDEMPEGNNVDYICGKLNCDYAYLSSIFSEVKGVTIQQFIINNKIERAKELLLYDELSLTEISYRLQYSSVAHLSNQFKKITGLSPSFYKKLQRKRKKILSQVANL